MKELETELDTTLFIRGNRQITLTKDGEYLFNQAQQILTLTNKTVNNLHGQHELSGSLYIGGAETQNMRTIGRAVTDLHQQYPKILTNIVSDNREVSGMAWIRRSRLRDRTRSGQQTRL